MCHDPCPVDRDHATAGATVQQRVQQPASAPSKQQSPAKQKADNERVNELNRLNCQLVRCNREPDPVCATGRGIAGCTPPELGCTYTNGCMARCVYGGTVSYLGECTHKDAMRVVEKDAPPPRKDCQCEVKFEPVCARTPECKMPSKQAELGGRGDRVM